MPSYQMAHSMDDSKEDGPVFLRTVAWEDRSLVLIDQTKLPNMLTYVRLDDYKQAASAIKNLVVRGAPAIGVTAAFGLALAAIHSNSRILEEIISELNTAQAILRSTRPTAVNLVWALERVMKKAREQKNVADVKNATLEEALKMSEEDIQVNKQMGINGADLIEDGDVILTHCNAGSLATVGYGTCVGCHTRG